MAKQTPLGLFALLQAMGTPKYARLVREYVSQSGDTFPLEVAIRNSDIAANEKTVLIDFITGKLKRPTHRPPSQETPVRELRRALTVLDLEASGWSKKRESTIARAAEILQGSSVRTIERALAKHERYIKLVGIDKFDWIERPPKVTRH